ncbi:MAG: PQQ-dependent sugar dehydrogenase [Thaumarchaeota archaeon]|nr:PQQ-dependent sugar dehydrogenase [Nitrososphaerota archaeon]
MKLKGHLVLLLVPLLLLSPAFAMPSINDNSLVVQKYVSGICCGPTTMAFMGNDDMFVLEKTSGEVHVIRDGAFQGIPVLKENVTTGDDQGMLGIDVVGSKVYLYFTESSKPGGPALGNRVYSYDWDGQNLVNKTLVKKMPSFENYHIGGVMTTDLNGSVYLVVGDNGRVEEQKAGVLENNATGEPDDTGVIVRIVPPGPYYAIGIRNSFGLTVDPVTGRLWDTENGPDHGDEVNLVTPNFNSGWGIVAGKANVTQLAEIPHYQNYTYHDPQFTWEKPVAPTGISFVDSDKFPNYKNSVFVGDCNYGNLYNFELDKNRDGFVFKTPQLQDNVANIGDPLNETILGTGFGCLTDIKVGPDGLVYIVSYTDGDIYRIVPKQYAESSDPVNYYQYLIYMIPAAGAALLVAYFKSKKKPVASNKTT